MITQISYLQKDLGKLIFSKEIISEVMKQKMTPFSTQGLNLDQIAIGSVNLLMVSWKLLNNYLK